MLTGHLEQLGIPDRERKRKCSDRSYSCLCLAHSNSLPLPFRTPATQASLCPASDQASGLIYTETTKAKYHKGKETPAPKKRKIKCHKIAKHVCTSPCYNERKESLEQSKHSIHGYPKSFVPGTKFSSLRPHIGPCHINITVVTVKVIHKCNLGKEYSKTRH